MHQKERLISCIELRECIIGLRDDGIIHVYFKPECVIDIPLQFQMLEAFNSLCGNVKRPFLYEGGEFVSITSEARDHAISMEDMAPNNASVVVVKNIAQKLVADFYYKFNKPKLPYKVTNQFEKALEWCKEYIPETIG